MKYLCPRDLRRGEMEEYMMDGILIINKDRGMTLLYDVVVRLERDLARKKIGHSGTLDPQASGDY